MTYNTGSNFDPNYPYGIDFVEIGVEEPKEDKVKYLTDEDGNKIPYKEGKMWIDEDGLHYDIKN